MAWVITARRARPSKTLIHYLFMCAWRSESHIGGKMKVLCVHTISGGLGRGSNCAKNIALQRRGPLCKAGHLPES